MLQHDLEEILAFHTLVLGKSEVEKSSLATKMGIDFTEYKQRIIGKEKECEFLVIMKALKVLKHLVAYDENLSHITQEFTADYLIEMPDGYRMMLEIKHTDKEKYSISGGNLQKRIAFAQNMRVPLRFAISICGYWGLFTTEFLQSKSGRIELSDYIENSWLDIEFATCSYMFTDEIRSESIFSQQTTDSLGINFPPHGELISYRLFSGSNLLFEVTSKDDDCYIYIFLLGALQDRMAHDFQSIDSRDDGSTLIIEKITQEHVISEFEFVLSLIKHLSPIKGTNSDDNIFAVATPGSKNTVLPHIAYYRLLMFELADKGVAITCFRGGYGYPFKDFAKKYWTKTSSEIE